MTVERTLSIVKPDGVAKNLIGEVYRRFEKAGLKVVAAAGFQAYGCPHTVAAASAVAEWLEGRPLAEARKLDVKAVCAELEVPVEKLGKLLRIEDAVAACCQ